jgi:hypothetical protein
LSLPVRCRLDDLQAALNMGLCPGYRFGKHLRFTRDEVLAWIETRRDAA